MMYAFFNQLAITIKHLPYLIHKTTHTPPPVDKARPQSITLSLLSLFISSLETLALLVCRMHQEALLRTHHTYIRKKEVKGARGVFVSRLRFVGSYSEWVTGSVIRDSEVCNRYGVDR